MDSKWIDQLKRDFGKLLRRLREAAGLTQGQLGKAVELSHKRISDFERAEFQGPPDDDVIDKLITTCVKAKKTDTVMALAAKAREDYRVLRRVLEDRDRRRPPSKTPTATDDEWAQTVENHVVWRHIDPDHDATDFRNQTIMVARHLSAVPDEAPKNDPWRDAKLATRINSRVTWLIDKALPAESLNLHPAEAALLALWPFVYQAHQVRSAATIGVEVDPMNLAQTGANPDTHRGRFERFLLEHSMLTNRATQPELPRRVAARAEISWWLFHRWLARNPVSIAPNTVASLLTDAVADRRIHQVLSAHRVSSLFKMLRLAPDELRNIERLDLRSENSLFGGSPEEQRIRERLLGFVLAVGHVLAVELTALPPTVVEHLAIPNPVDLAELRDTVADADWNLDSGDRGLTASCRHEATLEALREYASRVDALLGAVHVVAKSDSTLQVLRQLPIRASSDGVEPALDENGEPLFAYPSVRFHLDESRVRDLLMGEQLYRDRALAIRELYQNALDACRYREAREEYLFRSRGCPQGWQGKITFVQGVDQDGRHYLECSDNGVGMGESELRGAFANVGVRFADLTEFSEEQAEWATFDVRLHPNSRFGIGVMSYFMLADEIEVTTCRMDRHGGRPGPELRVAIVGPGHLFRVQRLAEHGQPGTRVRLYLRNGQAQSCVRELRKLLGIAEFATMAKHDDQLEQWEPFVLRPRERPSWEKDGIDAYGELVQCERRGGGQVIWCEHGGALLVDGLYVRPSIQRGILAAPGKSPDLRGAVVNLSRELAPNLSVDRTLVLSDVAEQVEKLITDATGELLQAKAPIPSFTWVSNVTGTSPRVADLVTTSAIAAEHKLALGEKTLDATVAGCFPLDAAPLILNLGIKWRTLDSSAEVSGNVPDHIALWRLLADGTSQQLGELTSITPEIRSVTETILPALPSDARILTRNTWTGDASPWLDLDCACAPGHLLWTAARIGVSPRQAALRAVTLGWSNVPLERFTDDPNLDTTDLALLSVRLDGQPDWLTVDEPVSVSHLLDAHHILGISMAESARRLEAYGFMVPRQAELPEQLDEADLRLLNSILPERQDRAKHKHWITGAKSIPPGLLIATSDRNLLTITEMYRRLVRYGLKSFEHLPERHNDDLALLSEHLIKIRPWLDPADPVPLFHIFKASEKLDHPASEVVDRIAKYGFNIPINQRLWKQLEERFDDLDQKLVSRRLTGISPWLDPATPVPLSHIFKARKELNLSTSEIVSRLTHYEFKIPGDQRLWGEAEEQDFPLLSLDRHLLVNLSQVDLEIDKPVPAYYLIITAHKLHMTVREVGNRLRELGFDIPDIPNVNTTVPVRTHDRDLRLLLAGGLGRGSWLLPGEPVPLYHLISMSRQLRMTISDMVDRLRELGKDVPDLADTVRKALARVPRATSGGTHG